MVRKLISLLNMSRLPNTWNICYIHVRWHWRKLPGAAPERKSWPDFHARALKAVTDLQAKGYHTFDLKSEIGSRPESLQPLTHLALGKKVIYNAPYNSSYAAQGDVTLTDGYPWRLDLR